jgi:hypothetical protein
MMAAFTSTKIMSMQRMSGVTHLLTTLLSWTDYKSMSHLNKDENMSNLLLFSISLPMDVPCLIMRT